MSRNGSSHPLLLVSLLLEDESPDEEDESSEPCAALTAACWAAISLGISSRSARILSVSPPRPMEVKKLMLKRMFLGVSCNMPGTPDDRMER